MPTVRAILPPLCRAHQRDRVEGSEPVTPQLEEAIELTVGGLATVFVLLVLLVILLVLLRRLLEWGPVSRQIAGPPPPEPDPDQRDRALASAIGVTIALTESGRRGRVTGIEEA